jgi:hypothetical protein
MKRTLLAWIMAGCFLLFSATVYIVVGISEPIKELYINDSRLDSEIESVLYVGDICPQYTNV